MVPLPLMSIFGMGKIQRTTASLTAVKKIKCTTLWSSGYHYSCSLMAIWFSESISAGKDSPETKEAQDYSKLFSPAH
jgi:hypothetical protein